MPWCHQCGRLVEEDDEVAGEPADPAAEPEVRPRREAPDAMRGRPLPEIGARPAGRRWRLTTAQAATEAHVKAPWHFKVLVVGTVVYLGYRLYQGIGWLIHHA